MIVCTFIHVASAALDSFDEREAREGEEGAEDEDEDEDERAGEAGAGGQEEAKGDPSVHMSILEARRKRNMMS